MLSGEDFESLDVQRWLGELETGAVLPEEDAEPKLICPWRRYFARTLDYLLCEQLLLTPIMLIARPNVDLSGIGVSVALTVGAIALMLLLEPLCLHYFGTTPARHCWASMMERPARRASEPRRGRAPHPSTCSPMAWASMCPSCRWCCSYAAG